MSQIVSLSNKIIVILIVSIHFCLLSAAIKIKKTLHLELGRDYTADCVQSYSCLIYSIEKLRQLFTGEMIFSAHVISLQSFMSFPYR